MEYPHRAAIARLRELNEEEGVRVWAQASTVRFRSEINLEEYNLMDVFPAWREACLGTIEQKVAKFADPARREGLREAIRQTGGGFGFARYPLAEMKVNWIGNDAPGAAELQERYEGWTIGEIAAREGRQEELLDVMLDIAVAAHLKVGFGTTMVEMDPQAVKEVATSTMALPGVSDGGAHTKFITTGRYATEMLAHWVREHEIMSLEEAHWRLSAYPAMAVGLKDRGVLAEGKPADVVVYDPDTVDCLDQERLFDYPAGEWRLVQKAKGYERIIVNGQTTFISGECTQETPGKLLRRGTD
jgi:N-acyl-D-aspartate/D-glutamate deacylase